MSAALQMEQAEQFWFRVQLDSTGAVKTCLRLAAAPDDEGAGVYYVKATDETQARADAYRRYQEKQRQALALRRERHKSTGRCQCGATIDTDGKTCARCQARTRESHQRHAARMRGEPVKPTPPKSVAFAETRQIRETSVRLSTLLEVRAAWMDSQNVGRFTAWLKAQIVEAGGTP